MGYHTEFRGCLRIDPQPAPEHVAYINAFADTRRMKRDPKRTAARPDPLRIAAGLPVGEEGGYFVGESGLKGQDKGPGVLNSNTEPTGQPGLWCNWHIDHDEDGDEEGLVVCWNGMEKFYDYVEWLHYLIDHFFGPWGYRLTGSILWRGEGFDDVGAIDVKDNVIESRQWSLTPPTPEEMLERWGSDDRDRFVVLNEQARAAGR